MRIAHVIPHSITFPLATHNGRYDWVLQLATIQADYGHEVTIYCNPASMIEGIRTVGIKVTNQDNKRNNIDTFKLALQHKHDIYHSHFDNLHYEIAPETDKQIVFTQHWWPSPRTVELANLHNTHNVWAVPPTHYMYEFDLSSGIPTKGHIYHGVDTSLFSAYPAEKNGRLLFVGRIAPEKNLPLVLKVAQRSGLGLDIIGRVPEKNQTYWQTLQPAIDGVYIRYLGPKDHSELTTYYAKALALLFPSDINEAFGLVAIESQLCGTPVIMYRGGSRGELIEEGKTGFLCDTEEDFIRAVRSAGNLDPKDCVRFAQSFDVHTMAERYQKLYQSLLKDQAHKLPIPLAST